MRGMAWCHYIGGMGTKLLRLRATEGSSLERLRAKSRGLSGTSSITYAAELQRISWR